MSKRIDWKTHLYDEAKKIGATIKNITKNKLGKITRESKVSFYCPCNSEFERIARNCVDYGGGPYVSLYCRNCTNKNRNEKIIATSRKKYNCDNPTQSPEVKAKYEKTCMERYGHKTSLLHEETKKKIEETCKKKYNVNSPAKAAQLPQFVKKREETNLKNHGVKNIFEKKEYIRDCTEESTGKRFNTQRPEIKDKIRKTNIQRYGTPSSLQNKEVIAKTKETLLKRTGFDHISKTDKWKKQMRDIKLSNTEEFIKKAKEKHKNENYSYDSTKYISSMEPVEITCLVEGHGIFKQTPSGHLSGSGCPKCGIITRTSKNILKHSIRKEEFIRSAKNKHQFECYKYEMIPEIITKGTIIKQPIICKEHGIFYQTPYDHINCGHGCPDCAKENRGLARRISQDAMIERFKKVHNIVKYKYDKVVYEGYYKNVLIGCSNDKHGYFLQTPGHHLEGNGCPKCFLKTESKFYEWLLLNKKELKIKNIYWKQKENIPYWASFRKPPHNGINYEYDFIIITENNDKIIIEIDGDQHFRQVQNWTSVLFTQIRDKIKEFLAYKNEYHFLRLNQMDIYNNKNDWEKIIGDFFQYLENNENTEIIYMNEGGSERFIDVTDDNERDDFRNLLKHHEYRDLLYNYYNELEDDYDRRSYGEGAGEGEGEGEGY